MKTTWCILIIGVTGILSGCATSSSHSDYTAFKDSIVMPELREGMTKSEIIEKFGQPDVVEIAGTVFCYRNYFVNKYDPSRSVGLELRFDSKNTLKGWDSVCKE